MASGGNSKRSGPGEHIFNYENTKHAFNQELGYVILEKKLQTRILLRREDVKSVINDIKENNINYKKYYTEKCQVVNENGKDILCKVTLKAAENKPVYVGQIKQILSVEDLFDVIFELHMQKPHLDEAGILDHFTNCVLFNAFINLFWKSCETCHSVIKNLDMYFRLVGEISIFTLNEPDGEFKDIFMYVERNTNFVLLRPLKSLSNNELAYELLTIFTDFGSPTYLDSNIFKRRFKDNKVFGLLKSLDPPFRIPVMYANHRNHKIDITMKKAIDMLYEWMHTTGSSNWAVGAHIVQWQMNTNKVADTYIRSRVVNGPIQSPYHAMFGLLPHTDIVKIKDITQIKRKDQSESTKNTQKVLVDCSQCNFPIFKVFKCNFCSRQCHFSCCIRYVEQSATGLIFINKCISCVNIGLHEKNILGT